MIWSWNPWPFEFWCRWFEIQVSVFHVYVRVLWFKGGAGIGWSDDELGGVDFRIGCGVTRRLVPEDDDD